MADSIEVGQVAPDFTAKNQDGDEITLSSFKGSKNVVLAFYPFDWSPVCTDENCAISQDLSQFTGKDSIVFGISIDSQFCHKAWKDHHGLGHDLLSDHNREVCKKYGLFNEALNCCERATVIVNQEGNVVYKKVQELTSPRENNEIVNAIP